MGYYHKTSVPQSLIDRIASEKKQYEEFLEEELALLRESFPQKFEELSSQGEIVFAGRNSLLSFGTEGYNALHKKYKGGMIPQVAFQFGKKFAVVRDDKVVVAVMAYKEDLYAVAL